MVAWEIPSLYSRLSNGDSGISDQIFDEIPKLQISRYMQASETPSESSVPGAETVRNFDVH